MKDISNDCLIGSSSLTFHLDRLQELRLVERRLPVTLTTAQQRRSKQGRYHLSDPFFRFYFRFLFPHQRSLMSPEERTAHIKSELRAFVGLAFEKLAQQWVVVQARAGNLPFAPEAVGSHWSRRVQVDVVAINHQIKCNLRGAILPGLSQHLVLKYWQIQYPGHLVIEDFCVRINSDSLEKGKLIERLASALDYHCF